MLEKHDEDDDKAEEYDDFFDLLKFAIHGRKEAT